MTEIQAILFMFSYFFVRFAVPVVILFVIGTWSQRRARQVGDANAPTALA